MIKMYKNITFFKLRKIFFNLALSNRWYYTADGVSSLFVHGTLPFLPWAGYLNRMFIDTSWLRKHILVNISRLAFVSYEVMET